MGKSVQSPARALQQFSRVITSNRIQRRSDCQIKPAVSKTRPTKPPSSSQSQPATRVGSPQQWPQLRAEYKNMEAINSKPKTSEQGQRLPLAEVVADCVKRWFQDTLKEAKAGDTSMQVLVSQMYHSGYGIPKDDQKGRAWMNKASRTRSSVWKVSDKRPGYNASDSDSDDTKPAAK
ncbi:OLC1v1026922C1 [Oldenlandia corymbosa var. corymbosa]|uniref:OLC1v1026922C1 n=1 Tax=Oldenlandia corymbosa var. corymbosa TaxID=529605 RepID=A0AAV1C8R7_OLDCO|nr:OLC1v1026922C1 [Oldenlandia corymbosa var. corymbosa]